MKRINLLIVTSVSLLASCDRDAFLSEKPNSSIVVPTRLEELRGLLDEESKVIETPLLGIQSSDEYYWQYPAWESASAKDRAVYTWADDTYGGNSSAIADWDRVWHQVFLANVVLEGLAAFPAAERQTAAYQDLKGAALFTRAKALFSLAEVFCLPYDEVTADTDLGLPLRQTANVNQFSPRANLRATYAAINDDLRASASLLQSETVLPNLIRPTKVAAHALLARVKLAQRDYPGAGAHADSALQLYDRLLDFNTITDHFGIDHPEAIYQNRTVNVIAFSTASRVMHVDSVLYALYDDNDLRKTLYYKLVNGRITLKRTYSGTVYPFTGLAVDELYLIRAECSARDGRLGSVVDYMNALLSKRYTAGSFVSVTAFDNPSDALDFVLTERRKELAFRGARWSDVRRLNKEGREVVFKRHLNGVEFQLPPNDLRYALTIPSYEEQNYNLTQNNR